MPAPDLLVFRAADHKALLGLLEDLSAPARRSAPLPPLRVQLDRLVAIRRRERKGSGET